jgi:hypothetical protein
MQSNDAAQRSAHVARGPGLGERTTDRCVCCGKRIGDKDKMAARFVPGLGLRQSCSDTCRAAPAWQGIDPREDRFG